MFANRKLGVTTSREHALQVLKGLKKATSDLPPTLADSIDREYNHDPYIQLISCLLSLRAKDKQTLPIARELFKHARTPYQMVKLSQPALEKLIYSIGFYKQKARTVRAVSQALIDRFGGQVPRTREELLTLDGVGRKTANLIMGVCYGVPAICVDVHVHRLSNLLGFVHTKTPEQTEAALEQLLAKKWWIEVNDILVRLGQNVALVAPRLSPELRQRLRPLLPKALYAR